tara:strand:+ start:573 stop:1271 length:699 start_codon:yes stop_codon:yes gene_type:complete
MINVVFCGYRQWAHDAFEKISGHPRINIKHLVHSKEAFTELFSSIHPDDIDVVVLLGWSWFVKTEVLTNFKCVGIHPSDLPSYRGGSPIQNQIIRGISKTRASLMSLSPDKMDEGDIWLREDLDLTGDSIEEIFINLVECSTRLLTEFFDKYPGISPEIQVLEDGSYFKRRLPEDSKLIPTDFAERSTKELYNFMRCLTDPYPNAYLEDCDGNRLIFTGVKYAAKESPDDLV